MTCAVEIISLENLCQHPPPAGLAQLGERQTEVELHHLSEGRVFDPHKPQVGFFFWRVIGISFFSCALFVGAFVGGCE